MADKSQYKEGKVYLRTLKGTIYSFSELLAKQPGVQKVIPNPTAEQKAEHKAKKEAEQKAKEEAETQARQKAEAAKLEAARVEQARKEAAKAAEQLKAAEGEKSNG
ncbi:hypothetical protein KC887_06170 [Candidatus Kaiserbacteria bacterium]|nr:hypothetical protein [Candidatus Kaiserbacteria bacterium]